MQELTAQRQSYSESESSCTNNFESSIDDTASDSNYTESPNGGNSQSAEEADNNEESVTQNTNERLQEDEARRHMRRHALTEANQSIEPTRGSQETLPASSLWQESQVRKLRESETNEDQHSLNVQHHLSYQQSRYFQRRNLPYYPHDERQAAYYKYDGGHYWTNRPSENEAIPQHEILPTHPLESSTLYAFANDTRRSHRYYRSQYNVSEDIKSCNYEHGQNNFPIESSNIASAIPNDSRFNLTERKQPSLARQMFAPRIDATAPTLFPFVNNRPESASWKEQRSLQKFPSLNGVIDLPPGAPGQELPREVVPARRHVYTSLWEEEGTLCLVVELRGMAVTRRCDNNMINGTKLLNSANITRGRRDGVLKGERTRHVVKVGGMDFKGVWIPFERALEMAQREKVLDALFPLFVANLTPILYSPQNYSRLRQLLTKGARRNPVFNEWIHGIPTLRRRQIAAEQDDSNDESQIQKAYYDPDLHSSMRPQPNYQSTMQNIDYRFNQQGHERHVIGHSGIDQYSNTTLRQQHRMGQYSNYARGMQRPRRGMDERSSYELPEHFKYFPQPLPEDEKECQNAANKKSD